MILLSNTIISFNQSAENRDDLSEDLKDEVTQTLSILKRLSKPKPVHLEGDWFFFLDLRVPYL